MHRIRLCLAALALALAPTAAMVASAVTAPPAHAIDSYDCTDSYLPCDGSTLEMLGGAPDYQPPPPDDPIYSEPLSDDWDWWWFYGSGGDG